MTQAPTQKRPGRVRAGVSPGAGDALAVRPVRRDDLDQAIAIDAAVRGLEKRKYWASVYRRFGAGDRSEQQFQPTLIQFAVASVVAGQRVSRNQADRESEERRSGRLGPVPMPPNAGVPDADVKALVGWIPAGAE